MDIKQRLKQVLDARGIHETDALCRDALARIEVLERLHDRADDLVEAASRLMGAILGTDYAANRVYDFDGMADDAIAAATALLSKLKASNR